MNKFLNKYINYELPDFLGDEDYIFNVKSTEAESSAFLVALLKEFPHKKQTLLNARELIIALSTQEVQTGEGSKEVVWQNIISQAHVRQRPALLRNIYYFRRIAATVLFFVLCSFAVYYYLHSDKLIKTDFDHTMVVRLPDESVITLNRNSSIIYSRNWNSGGRRDVRLTGEANFEVKHVAIRNQISEADSFRVHVNGLIATVLGTQFNIRSRRGKTAVSLSRGKLRIDFLGNLRKSILLLPGEEFVYDPRNLGTGKAQANIKVRFAWKNEALVLQATPVSDIIDLLEDDFGYQVKINDPTLLKRKISGTVPMKKLDDLFFVLSKILNVRIEQNDKTLIINPNK